MQRLSGIRRVAATSGHGILGIVLNPPALQYNDYDGSTDTTFGCGDGNVFQVNGVSIGTIQCGTLLPGQR